MTTQNYNAEFEETMLIKMLTDANEFKESSRILAVDEILEGNGVNTEETYQEFVSNIVENTKIREKEYFN